MRYLLASAGTAGDTYPFIALGKALRDRGHDVALIGNGAFRGGADACGLPFVDLLSPAEHHARSERRAAVSALQSVSVGVQHLVDDSRRVYHELAARADADTVVVCWGFLFGGRLAQEKLGLRLATVHLAPICFRTRDDDVAGSWITRLVAGGVWNIVDWFIARKLGKPLNALRAELDLPPLRNVMDGWWHSPQCVLGLFPDWFSQPRRRTPPHCTFTGFPRNDASPDFPDRADLEAFLQAGDPPVVISHSSSLAEARRFFETSLAVVRRLGRRAVVLAPRDQELPETDSRDVLRCGFAPHSWLFPRASLVIHHAGMGTLAAACQAGVPQLAVPHYMDQPDNAQRLAKLGIGAAISPGKYRVGTALAAARRLLDDPAVAARCRETAARCAAENGLERACDVLEETFGAPAAAPRVLTGSSD